MRYAICAAVLWFVASSLTAQSITLRLVNGKNGKPMSDQNVAVSWDDSFIAIQVRVDRDGRAVLAIPPGTLRVTFRGGSSKGKEPNRVAYLDCNSSLTSLAAADLSLNQILAHGFVAKNQCSRKVQPVAKPGEVIFLAEPRSQPDMQ
jgi:hypothetical protein